MSFMMKLIFSSLCLIVFSTSALACRPGPLAECKKLDFKVNPKSYHSLQELVSDYQQLLSAKLSRPTNASSCFNNRFAEFYGQAFSEKLKEQKGKTCKDQVDQVKGEIKKLIDPQSIENQSVFHKADKKHLKSQARKISIGLLVLP
jgi:predicted O-linked N-acetylglucosamine transferase (SPINDLY family)